MTNAQEMRSFDAWVKSIRNFAWLGDAVPGATDLDLFIERRGHFFVAEAKPYINGVNLPFGQFLALDALAELEEFEVLLVGEADRDVLYVHRIGDDEPIRRQRGPVWYPPAAFRKTNKQGLAGMAKRWFARHSR